MVNKLLYHVPQDNLSDLPLYHFSQSDTKMQFDCNPSKCFCSLTYEQNSILVHTSPLENLTILIAQCLVTTIKDLYDIKLDIKYPNDVMCNRKKVSGILTESVTNKEIVKYVFIGIGIDVNQIIFTPEIEQIATSLKKEYNKEFNREEIISSFFNTFEKEYKKLIN